jgi:hypothetical protein
MLCYVMLCFPLIHLHCFSNMNLKFLHSLSNGHIQGNVIITVIIVIVMEIILILIAALALPILRNRFAKRYLKLEDIQADRKPLTVLRLCTVHHRKFYTDKQYVKRK